MPNNQIFIMILTAIIIVIIVLIIIFLLVYIKSRKKSQTKKAKDNSANSKEQTEKRFVVDSVIDFMEFDRVEDNMIIQKDGFKYIMVIECQGINYDLMSEIEKNSVEEGFIQFLNTIRYPIQIYVQTRTINLENSLQTYKDKVHDIEENLFKQEVRYKEMLNSNNYTQEQINSAYYELTKQRNLNEYGKDIINNTERMSLNKNVLNQKYYVIVPYYIEDAGQNNLDNEEMKNMAFSELYTRCQALARTLAGCEVNGKILNSNELMELLYVAYNRDEQETFGIERALRAGYDELYSTAPDVLDKKMRELDKKIEEEGFNIANEKVIEAQSEKEKALRQKEESMDDLISQMAELIIEQNRAVIGSDIADNAIDKVKKDKEQKENGGASTNVKEKTEKRRTATRTA